MPGPVTYASFGVFHSFAIVENKLYGWGSNAHKQLGPTIKKVKDFSSKPI